MNIRFRIIYIFMFTCMILQNNNVDAQLKYYEDSFHGGVTAGGYSPGISLGSSSGTFSIHIGTGSSIRKAFLFAGNNGQASSITVTLNGNNISFDSTTIVTSFYSPYGGVASVHSVEVTNLLNDTILNYTFVVPGSTTINNYTDFYLYVAYDNPANDIVNTAIFLNNHMVDWNVTYNLNLTYPILNSMNVGLSVSGGYMCSLNNDGENVYINGTYIGRIGGHDVNSSGFCAGIMGSFYYESNTLYGLSDDFPDLAVDSSDALSNIQTIIPSSTNMVNILFTDDSTTSADNNIWLATLTYGVGITGINNIAQSNLVTILYNSDNETFTIDCKDNDITEIIIYDMLSRKLLQQKFIKSKIVSRNQFRSGVYIYQLRKNNVLIKKGKIVKQ